VGARSQLEAIESLAAQSNLTFAFAPSASGKSVVEFQQLTENRNFVNAINTGAANASGTTEGALREAIKIIAASQVARQTAVLGHCREIPNSGKERMLLFFTHLDLEERLSVMPVGYCQRIALSEVFNDTPCFADQIIETGSIKVDVDRAELRTFVKSELERIKNRQPAPAERPEVRHLVVKRPLSTEPGKQVYFSIKKIAKRQPAARPQTVAEEGGNSHLQSALAWQQKLAIFNIIATGLLGLLGLLLLSNIGGPERKPEVAQAKPIPVAKDPFVTALAEKKADLTSLLDVGPKLTLSQQESLDASVAELLGSMDNAKFRGSPNANVLHNSIVNRAAAQEPLQKARQTIKDEIAKVKMGDMIPAHSQGLNQALSVQELGAQRTQFDTALAAARTAKAPDPVLTAATAYLAALDRYLAGIDDFRALSKKFLEDAPPATDVGAVKEAG
jgi:hypothetical protein